MEPTDLTDELRAIAGAAWSRAVELGIVDAPSIVDDPIAWAEAQGDHVAVVERDGDVIIYTAHEPRAIEAAAWRAAIDFGYRDPPRRRLAVCDDLGMPGSRADMVTMEDDALLADCAEQWFLDLDARADRTAIELGYRTAHDPLQPDADGISSFVNWVGYDGWREGNPTTYWRLMRHKAELPETAPPS